MIVVTNCSGLSIDFDNLTIYRVDKFKRDPKKVTPAESEEWSEATKILITKMLKGQEKSYLEKVEHLRKNVLEPVEKLCKGKQKKFQEKKWSLRRRWRRIRDARQKLLYEISKKLILVRFGLDGCATNIKKITKKFLNRLEKDTEALKTASPDRKYEILTSFVVDYGKEGYPISLALRIINRKRDRSTWGIIPREIEEYKEKLNKL
jgi:hypothetical protein